MGQLVAGNEGQQCDGLAGARGHLGQQHGITDIMTNKAATLQPQCSAAKAHAASQLQPGTCMPKHDYA